MIKALKPDIQTAIHERAKVLGPELGLHPDAVAERLTEMALKSRRGHAIILADLELKFRSQQSGQRGKSENFSSYYRPGEDPAELISSDFKEPENKPSGSFIHGSDDADEDERSMLN